MGRHPRWVVRVFSPDDLQAMQEAIARAEAETSAEIRVHLEHRIPRADAGDALARARQVFGRLGMHRTARRNGVLIYLALADRRLAIVGDQGIHDRVGDGYWATVRDHMIERLRQGRLREAVLQAVAEAGQTLREHFPREPGDADELSDEISVS
jgi:uncharacterized membrane protein